MKDEKLEVPPPPTLMPCVRPGPLLTYVELPEVPTMVPELSATQNNPTVPVSGHTVMLERFLQHDITDAAP